LRWSRDNFVSIATIFLLIGLPPFGIFVPLLLADFHGGSILFALVALLLLSGIAKPSPIQYRPLRVFAFAVLTIAAVSSDPFVIVFAFGPTLLVLGIEFLAADHGLEGLGLIVLVASCSMIGFFLPTAIAHFGGFVTEPTVQENFVTAEHLRKTLAGFFFGFLYSSGAYIFGKHPLDLDTLANGARFVGWLIGGVAVLTRIAVICRPRSDGLLDRLLLASLAAIVSACVLSRWFDLSVPDSVLNGGAGTRFIAPALVFAAILAARAIPEMIGALPTQRSASAVTAFIVMLAGGLLIEHMRAGAPLVTSPPWTAQNEYIAVSRWLEAHHLTCGVGEYWSSSIITALTGGNVTVRPVESTPRGDLAPFKQRGDMNWYRSVGTPAFAIWREDHIAAVHVDDKTATATYGKPLHLEYIAPFTIALLAPDSSQQGPAPHCP
jgi:hypothetical protein